MKNLIFLAEDFKTALLASDRKKASDIFALCAGNNEYNIVSQMVTRTLEGIGLGFSKGIYALSQVYLSGLICEALVSNYKLCGKIEPKAQVKMAIGLLNEIDTPIVKIFTSIIRSASYDIIDLGQGLNPNEVVEKAILNEVAILFLPVGKLSSALLVKKVRLLLIEKKVKMRIVVGGIPFNLSKDLWKRVMADAQGENAMDILAIIDRLVRL